MEDTKGDKKLTSVKHDDEFLKERFDGVIYETKEVASVVSDDSRVRSIKRKAQPKANVDIDVSPLEPELAFEKFAGHIYDPSNLDFLNNTVMIHQISSGKTEYASSDRSKYHFESPIESFNRLKSDVDTFKRDLVQLRETDSKDNNAVTICNALSDELSKLSSQLLDLSSDPSYQAYLTTALPSTLPVVDPLNRLKSQLNSFKIRDEAKTNDKVTYELYLPPKPPSTIITAQVEKRVSALEEIVGSKDELPIPYDSVRTAIHDLNHRLSLLDKGKLESVYRRMQAMLKDLEVLEKTKTKVSVDSGENDVYTMMLRWDAAAKQLTPIINRLRSLKSLHSMASQSALRVKNIGDAVAELDKIIKDDNDTLLRLEKSISMNNNIILSNIEKLEKRIASLEKKR